MAQQVSQINYFPFNVNFYSDPKIEFIEAEFGLRSLAVIQKLLCRIYENSFYCEWNKDICMLFAKRLGSEVDRKYIQNIIDALIKRDFLDKEMYQRHGILTSKGIQRRYFTITSRRKNLPEFPLEYILIDISSYKHKGTDYEGKSGSGDTNESLTPGNGTLSTENAGNSKQRKGEKTKRKKKKEEHSTEKHSLSCVSVCGEEVVDGKVFHDFCKVWREKLLSSAEWCNAFCRQSGLGTDSGFLIPQKMNEFEDFIVSGGEQSSIGSEQDYARRFHFWWQYHGSKLPVQDSGNRNPGVGQRRMPLGERNQRPSRIEELNQVGEESLKMAYQILGRG